MAKQKMVAEVRVMYHLPITVDVPDAEVEERPGALRSDGSVGDPTQVIVNEGEVLTARSKASEVALAEAKKKLGKDASIVDVAVLSVADADVHAETQEELAQRTAGALR